MVKLQSGKTIKVKPDNLKRLESFSGFGKGFMASAKPDAGSPAKPIETNGDGGEGIEFVKPKNPDEKPGMFSEVQDAMKNAAPFLEQTRDQWCTPALMEKLAKNPGLLKMMQYVLYVIMIRRR